MKKLLLGGLLLGVAIALPLFGERQDTNWYLYGGDDALGGAHAFSQTVCDTDIDAAWELLSAFDEASFVQLAADSTIKVYNQSSTDTAWIMLAGIRASDERWVLEDLAVPASVTSTSTNTWMLFDAAYLREQHGAALLAYSDGASARGSLLDSIPAGKLDYPLGHLFGGSEHELVIDQVTYQVVDSAYTVDFQLRVFPDHHDARADSVGYVVQAPARVDGSQGPTEVSLPVHLRLPKSAFVQLYAKGAAVNSHGCATLTGRRWRR